MKNNIKLVLGDNEISKRNKIFKKFIVIKFKIPDCKYICYCISCNDFEKLLFHFMTFTTLRFSNNNQYKFCIKRNQFTDPVSVDIHIHKTRVK